MSIMTSQILKFMDSWKTQKSKYLEHKIKFFCQLKKIINCTLRVYFSKNSFLVGVTFNLMYFLQENKRFRKLPLL